MGHAGRTDRREMCWRSEGGVIAGRHLGGLALSTALVLVTLAAPMPGIATTARAGSCTGTAGGPYTIPSQGTPINLATDCGGGVAGQVTVTGDVTGNNTAHLIRDSRTDEQQPWTIIVNPGVTVEDAVNADTDAMNFRVSGVTIDNAGTISAPTTGAKAIDLQRGGTVINRGTGTINALGDGIFSGQNNFTLTNEAGGQIRRVSVSNAQDVLIENAGRIDGGISDALIIGNVDSEIVRNSGTIEATSASKFAISYLGGTGATAFLENSGTITGGANARAINYGSAVRPGDITNSGTITGGALGAIRFANVDDRLELQPGSVITGEVAARDGTDTLAFGGTGNGTFDLSAIGAGQQYTNFDVFSIEEGTWSYSGTTGEDFSLTGGRVTGSGTFTGAVNATGSASIDSTTLNGPVTVDNGATLTLDGTNTVGGTITVADGTLSLLTSTAANGATIETTGSVINYGNGVNIAAPVTLNSNTTQLQVLTGTATQTGVISETGGARPVEKIGGGTLILAGNNSYTGATVITAGTLRPDSNERINNNSDLVINGGTLNVRGRRETVGNLSGTGGGIEVGSGTRLTVQQTVDGTYAGDFTGGLPVGAFTPAFDKQGAATLTLTGNNTQTGGSDFFISAGTLRVDNGNAIGDDARVSTTIGSTFELLANETVAIIGDGAGGGTINLNNNTLTLSAFPGGSLGAPYSGSIIGDGGLTLNHIGPAGSTPSGLLNLDLTGANSFSGPVQITSGILNLFNGAALADTVGVTLAASNFAQLELIDSETIGSLTGGAGSTIMLNGGSILTTNGNGASTTVASTISGNGGLTKEGAGLLALTGNNSYIGPTTVNAGLLIVDGSIASSAVTVANGGTLGGVGTVGQVLNNGVIAPGNSIGTLNVAGDVTFNASSRYDVEIAANGTSDLVNATGVANLGGNGQVNPVRVDPVASYMNGQTYTILTAAGGVNGQFAGVTDNSALLDYALTYDPNNVYLSLALVQPVTQQPPGMQQPGILVPNYPLFATTFNQTQLATALLGFDFVPEPDLLAQLLGLDAARLASAYDAMTGEVYATGLFMAAGAGSQFTNLLMANAFGGDIRTGRASVALGMPAEGAVAGLMTVGQDALPAGTYPADALELDDAVALAGTEPWLTAWAGGYGASVDVDGDTNATPWNATVWGFGTGLEADLSARLGSNTAIGAGFGYGRTDGGVNARNQALDIESWQWGIYGRTGATPLQKGFALRGAASAAYQRYDAMRTMTVGGIARQARAAYDGGLVSGAFEARYQIPFGLDLGSVSGTAVIAPLLRAQASHVWTGGFTEIGAGALNLTAGAQSHTDASVSAGVALSGAFRVGDLDVKPSVSVAYDRLIGGRTASATLSLGGSPTAFSVRGPAESPDRLRLGTVTEIGFDERVSLNLATDTLLSSDRTEFSAKANLNIAF